MMREEEVDSSRVDVHVVTEDLGSHNGALNVPPWPPVSPW